MKKIKAILMITIVILGVLLIGCDKNKTSNSTDVDDKTTEVSPPSTTCVLDVITNDGGSSNISQKEYAVGDLVELWATPQEGYKVKGWYSKDNILLSSSNTYSFIIKENTVIELEFIQKIVLDTDSEIIETTELSGVGTNFAILVECPEENAKEYIKENLHIYDEYFLDDENKVYPGYENHAEIEIGVIESKGNDMYLVYPAQNYSRSGAYVIQSKNNVTVYKKGSQYIEEEAGNRIANLSSTATDFKGESGDFTFTVGNYEHIELELADNVLIFATSDNVNANDSNVDGQIIEVIGCGYTVEEEEIIGGFTCDFATSLLLEKGKKIIFGGNVIRNGNRFDCDQATENTVFGEVYSINKLGDGNYPLCFIEIKLTDDPEDFFENIDVYTNHDVELEEGDISKTLEEDAMDLLYQNDEFISFLAAVYESNKEFNRKNLDYKLEEKTIDVYIKGWKIRPSYSFDGSTFIFDITGTYIHNIDHTKLPGIQANQNLVIEFRLVQEMEFDVDFSWIYKENLGIKRKNGIEAKLNTDTKSKFSFEVKMDFALSSLEYEYVLNTASKIVHRNDCAYCKTMKDSNKKISKDSLDVIFYSGYEPCFSCLKGSKELWKNDRVESGSFGATYSEILEKTIRHRDFNDSMKEIKGFYGGKGSNQSEQIRLATVPVAVLPFLNCTIDVYFYFKINIEAAIKCTAEVTSKSTIGVRATLKSVKLIASKEYSLESFNVDLTGKLRAEIGIEAQMKLSTNIGKVSVALYLKAYPYVELGGIIHYDSDYDDYIGGYAEVGLGVAAGIKYDLLTVVKGDLVEQKEDIPLKQWGYDHAILGYKNEIIEYSVNPDNNIVTIEELGLNEVRMLDVKKVFSSYEEVEFTTAAFIIEMYLENAGNSWFEVIDYEGSKAIKVKDNAPFNSRFNDIVVITIKSKNYQAPFGKYYENTYAVNLPTIKIKLIGEIKCSEHQYAYFASVDPTCENDGFEGYNLCTRCGRMFNADLTMEISNVKSIPALGHELVKIDEKLPTCKEAGHSEGECCSRCDLVTVEPEEIAVIDHIESQWITKTYPTCTLSGSEYIKCTFTDCGEIIKTRPILPKGHKVSAENRNATCELGVNCTECGEEIEKALGHIGKIETIRATCTTDGKQITTCSRGGCSYRKEDVLKATGHSTKELAIEKYGEASIYTNPTCEVDGYWTFNCEYCGKEIIETNLDSKLGHEFGDLILGTEPSCEEEGIISHYQCKLCNQYFNENKEKIDTYIKEANSHLLRHIKAVPATCQSTGRKEYWICENIYNSKACNKMFFDSLGKEPITDEKALITAIKDHEYQGYASTEPTCTTDGNITYWKCRYCETYALDTNGFNKVSKDEIIISKLGHSFDLIEKVDATCTQNGNCEYWKCSTCDALSFDNQGTTIIKIDETIIEKLGHDYVKNVFEPTCDKDGYTLYECLNDSTHNYIGDMKPKLGHATGQDGITLKPATCTEEGQFLYYCSNEGCEGKIESIPPLGHKVNEYNICSTCKISVHTKGLIFTEIDDYYFVNGFENKEENVLSLVIPSIYNDKKVIGISENAFNGSKIETVSLPLGIKIIEDNAFNNCLNLDTINIPSSVIWIGSDAFKDCQKLVNIALSNSIKWYSGNEKTLLDISSPSNVAEKLVTSGETIYQLLTITYHNEAGSELKKYEYIYKEAINHEYELTKVGHTFKGWDKECPLTMPYENVIITSKGFITNYYNLVIDETVISIIYDGTINEYLYETDYPEIFEKDGYRFAGFDKELPQYMPAEDIYVKTLWNKLYKISVYNNLKDENGNYPFIYSKSYVYGETISLSEPYQDNPDYLFNNWATSIPVTMPENDLTIFADCVRKNIMNKTIRTSEYTITDSGRMEQSYDSIDIGSLSKYQIIDYKNAGCTKVKITIKIDVAEIDDGYQYLFLYDNLADSTTEQTLKQKDGSNCSVQIDHSGSGIGTTYTTYTYEFEINLSEFQTSNLVIRYGADGKNDDDWKNKNLIISLQFS